MNDSPDPLGPGGVELRIDASRTIRAVTALVISLAVLLLLLDYSINYSRWTEMGPIRRLFNATREDALLSWLSVTWTFVTAVTTWGVVGLLRMRETSRTRVAGWSGVAAFLSWMAMDDGAVVHERLGSGFGMVREGASAGGWLDAWFSAWPSYGWQFAVLPFLGIAGVLALGWLWFDLERDGRLLVAGAAACFATAVVMDFGEGLDPLHPWNPYAAIADRWDLAGFTERQFRRSPYESLRHFSKTVEETIEVTGMALLWAAIAGRASPMLDRFRIRAD